jgi:hypothetical protein
LGVCQSTHATVAPGISAKKKTKEKDKNKKLSVREFLKFSKRVGIIRFLVGPAPHRCRRDERQLFSKKNTHREFFREVPVPLPKKS